MFWGFISSRWSPRFHGLSCSPVVPPGLSTCKCGTCCATSHHLAHLLALQLLPCYKSSPPRLPVSTSPSGLNECSLTLWLPDFHTVRFSVSSGYFLFLNLLLFFWLFEEASVSTYASILAWSSLFAILIGCLFFASLHSKSLISFSASSINCWFPINCFYFSYCILHFWLILFYGFHSLFYTL